MNEFSAREVFATIEAKERERLWRLYQREPTCRACVRCLKQFLFSDGLVASRKRKRLHTGLDVDHFNDTWLPIAHDIIDHVLCFGFVVIDCRELRVLPWEQYDVSVNERHKYRVRSTTASDEDLIVLDCFGTRPCTDGTIQSTLSCLSPVLQMWSEMVQLAIVAERRRADPVIFTEVQPTRLEQAEGVAYDVYGDGTHENDDLFYRDARAVERLEEIMRQAEDVRGGAENAKSTDRVTCLPMGHRIANLAPPQVRNDFVSVRTQVSMTICECIGVPFDIVSDGKAGVQGIDSFANHLLFRNTLQFWKTALEKAMNVVIAQGLAEDVAQHIVKKSQKSQMDAATRRKVADMQVVVEVPIIPFLSVDQAHDLHERGLLKPQEYLRILSKTLGIAENMLQRPPTPEILRPDAEAAAEPTNTGKDKDKDK